MCSLVNLADELDDASVYSLQGGLQPGSLPFDDVRPQPNHFVERLATGRRLVITSDHGYAASGHFPDADGDFGQFLKKTLASGRSTSGAGDTGPFVPPVVLQVQSPHGVYRVAVGRWKWRSQGGYPTLAHGGLSLLEVLSPFVEITK